MPYKDKDKQKAYQQKWERGEVGKANADKRYYTEVGSDVLVGTKDEVKQQLVDLDLDPEDFEITPLAAKRGRKPRHAVWAGIFYAESAPENWRDRLEEQGIEACVSPLHDKDRWTKADELKNPEHKEGELKKPHYHLLVKYDDNGVTYEDFLQDFGWLVRTNVKWCKSLAGMARYLDHGTKACERLGKVRYDSDGIWECCGADWQEWCRLTINVHETLMAMREWLIDPENWQLIKGEFAYFQLWCDMNNDEWSLALDTKCAWACKNFIDSYRNSAKAEAEREREAANRAAGVVR